MTCIGLRINHFLVAVPGILLLIRQEGFECGKISDVMCIMRLRHTETHSTVIGFKYISMFSRLYNFFLQVYLGKLLVYYYYSFNLPVGDHLLQLPCLKFRSSLAAVEKVNCKE